MDENPIRRERRRKAERKKLAEDMRSALPVYNLEDIRNHRMPYYEALLFNLEEKGYLFTCKYIKFLVHFQSQIRKTAGPASIVLMRPNLYESKSELKILSDRLVQAEIYHNSSSFAQECREILQAAVYFAFSNEFWWWLGEQLLATTLVICGQHTFLDKLYEALARYCYGKFLMENFKEEISAMEHLNIARELSKGKEWTTILLFPLEPDILFLKVNYLIYCSIIKRVEHLMGTDYKQAAKLAILAKKRAAEACFAEGEIRALMLKGMCQLSCNDTKGAIESFTKAYYIQARLGSEKGICEARIHIAQAYLLDGNSQLSLSLLLMLRESAEEHKLPYYLAQSYRHLGEFFLNHGEAPKATPLLKEALKLFNEFGYIKECEQVRNLEAISVGLQHFASYVHLLTRSNEKEYMSQLINWKDSNIPFTTHMSTTTEISVDDIIQQSVAEVQGRQSDGLMVPDAKDDSTIIIDDKRESLTLVCTENQPDQLVPDTEEDATIIDKRESLNQLKENQPKARNSVSKLISFNI